MSIIGFEWIRNKDFQRHYNHEKPEENPYESIPQGVLYGFEFNSVLDTQQQYSYEELEPNPYEQISQEGLIGFEWRKDIDRQEQYGYKYYESKGTWTSSAIDLGENVDLLYKLDSIVERPEGTEVNIYISTSKDGISFAEYQLINPDDTISSPSGRYIKIKIEMLSGDAESVEVNVTPSILNTTAIYSVLESKKPTLYVSRNDGEDWEEVSEDKLVDISNTPEGDKLRVKAVLQSGEEIYGLSYSWI